MMFLPVLLVFGQFSGLSLSGDDRVPVPVPAPVVVPPAVPTEPFPPMPPDEQRRVTIEPTSAPTPGPVPVPVKPEPVPRVAARPVPASAKSPPSPAFDLTWWPMRDYPGWEMHGRNAYGVIVDVDQFRWVGVPQAQVQMVQPASVPVMQPNVWSAPAMSVSGFGFRSGFMSRFGFGFGSGSCAGGSCR